MFCRFGGGYGPLNHFGIGGMFMGMIVFILFVTVVVILGSKYFGKHSFKSDSAMKILDEKFAGGEISEEEYLKRRAILNGK